MLGLVLKAFAEGSTWHLLREVKQILLLFPCPDFVFNHHGLHQPKENQSVPNDQVAT